MNTINLTQRSDEWKKERVGSIGASDAYDFTELYKSGPNKGKPTEKMRKAIMRVAFERVTGISTSKDVSNIASVKRGIELEPIARKCYENFFEVSVKEVGLFKHNRLPYVHASPDGIRNDTNVGLEIKCGEIATHWAALMHGTYEPKYHAQVVHQMLVCGFDAVDLVFYNDLFPPESQMVVIRIHRDAEEIAAHEANIERALAEIENEVQAYNARYGLFQNAA